MTPRAFDNHTPPRFPLPIASLGKQLNDCRVLKTLAPRVRLVCFNGKEAATSDDKIRALGNETYVLPSSSAANRRDSAGRVRLQIKTHCRRGSGQTAFHHLPKPNLTTSSANFSPFQTLTLASSSPLPFTHNC